MVTEKVVYKTQGIGVFGLLGVLFVGLKLASIINWSWWLVLLPFYGATALFFGLAIGMAIIAGILMFGAFLVDVITAVFKRRR